jgi:hypothetical protein
VLGRQAVVDAQHRMAAAVGERATHVVVRLEVADHPPATVEVDEQPEVVAVVRPVQASRHAAGVEVADLVDGLGGGRWRALRAARAWSGVTVLDRRSPIVAMSSSSDTAWGCSGMNGSVPQR